MSETVTLDVDLLETPVIFKTKQGEKTYFIREMSGTILEEFLEENHALMETAMTGDGKVSLKGIKSFNGMFAVVLKRCLFDEQGQAVPEAVIKALPLRIQQKLMEIAEDLNAFSKKTAQQVGNLQTGTESGISSPPGSTALSPDASGKPE